MTAAMSTFAGRTGAISVTTWAPADPRFVVLLVHGYGEHAGRYGHVAARLVDMGAVVVAPDHAGHGRSEGERARIEDLESLVDDLATLDALVRAEYAGLPVVLIGHSMGGLVATRYAQRGVALDALVLSGPVIGGNPDIAALLELPELPEVPLDPSVLSRDPAVGEAYAADDLVYHGPFQRVTLEAMFAAADAVRTGDRLGDVPTLWLHGELDALAPLAATRPVFEAIRGPHAEEKVYPGAQHEIFNETNQDEVLDDVVAFLERALAP